MGVGGQFAFYLGFHNRDLVRGVAATGAALTNQAKEKVRQPAAGLLPRRPAARIRSRIRGREPHQAARQKYPVVYHEDKDAGHQYLDDKALDELVRWIDSLDRL